MYKKIIDALIDERGFITDFSKEETAAAKAAAEIKDDDNRVDYRDCPLITIDGDSAHDFDDAVCCRAQPDGSLLLTVAIADVAAYVPPGSVLDRAARERGNSVYLPDRVIPMLPAALSNETCSLRPDEDRLTLICEAEIDAAGSVKRYRFFRAIIRSQRRLNYPDAALLMEGGGDETLDCLYTLADIMRRARRDKGAMLLERPEKTCHITDHGTMQVTCEPRTIAHYAIEEAMILANCCAADFLIQRQRPALYRIHARPAADKMARLKQTLVPLGIHLPAVPCAADFAVALEQIEARDSNLVEVLLPFVLGTLSRAEYKPDATIGHYGLACARYTHFTSPIRRYPDLLTHRALIAAMTGSDSPFTVEELAAIGAHCGETEVRADKAGWDLRQRLLCTEAEKMIDCEYTCYVSGMVPAGFFVHVAELGIDGMVRFSTLPGFWKYDNQKGTITSPDDTVLTIGSCVNVKLTAVVPEKGRADLTLVKAAG